jgi:hypothetical protein
MRRATSLALAAAACAAAALAQEPAAPPFLPTPYSAEQIREVWQPGFQVETKTTDAGGESLRRLTVVAASAEGCTIRSEALSAQGSTTGEPRELRSSWEELRDHARFAASKATRERAECRSPLGALPGWRYATTNANGDALAMCFADATPGPPVEYEVHREGKRISRTEHVQFGQPSGTETQL